MADTATDKKDQAADKRLVQTNPDYDPNVIVETQNLSKVYRDFWGRQKVRALKALDLEVRRGRDFRLAGAQWFGEIDHDQAVVGAVLFPTSGRALVFGKDATETTKNERIGYLPEESYLYKFLTAEETMDFYGRLFDMPASLRKERSDMLIDKVGLTRAKRRQLKEYSKGMTRRIGLAQALINDPDLVLLDEPTSGLDPMGTREMKDMILDLKSQNKTVIMCSHLLADVQDVCDRIAILHQGDLKELGAVKDLLQVKDETSIRARGLPPEAQDEIAEVIRRHGGEVITVENPRTTLEELFLNIVRESEQRPGRRMVSEEPAKGEES